MNPYSHYLALIEQAIAERPFNGTPKELYDPANYMLSLGGKRLRPVLVLMAHEMFGGNAEDALSAALAVEVFHNFTLVHDDIMDKAPLRRGKPTVHKKWDETVAILSGDLMMIRATELLCETRVKDLRTLLQLFNQTAIEVCEGQQWDMNYEMQNEVSAEEYIHMISLKTAVLLGCSLKLGALIAGSSAEDAESIYAFGKKIGIAFQIQDDMLDSFGEGEEVGKKIGGDIASNKKTILLIDALNQADPKQKQAIESLLNQPASDAKIKAMLTLFEQLGVRQLAETRKNQFLEEAFFHLDAIRLPKERSQVLRQMATELMVRTK